MPRFALLASLVGVAIVSPVTAAELLRARIDQLIEQKAKDRPPSPRADDGEFLRRVCLDFSGSIPSIEQTRAFLADSDPNKRAKVVDELLAGPAYATQMANAFHIMLMERIGENPAWGAYLRASFAENRPWDRMTREILRADRDDPAVKGAAFFIAKRLDKVGQQETDFPGLARDIGRVFLGRNLQCAQCHDHLFIDEYKQEHFQGLFAFIQNVYIVDVNAPSVAEKATTEKVAFMSVFKKVPKQIGPALPGGMEIEIPAYKKGEEYISAPDPRNKKPGVPKFSALAALSEKVADPLNPDFSRNIVNRLWFLMMGRGLTHPLDLRHKDNPPSHPELLELLATEFVEHKFDIKWLLREIALSKTYQRSSVYPKGVDSSPPELFLTAIEKRISAEQLTRSMLEATGERPALEARRKPETNGTKNDPLEALLARFQKAFANPAREPEEEFTPSLRAALFLLNDPTVLEWLTVRPGNLMDRVSNLDDARAIEEVYLSVLTRAPEMAERQAAAAILKKHAADRNKGLSQMIWALLASTEFSVNH
jgi:hypothetical protein